MKNAEKEIMLFEIKNSRTLRKGVGCRNKHAKPRTNNRINNKTDENLGQLTLE